MDTPDPVTRLNAALQGRYAIERELGEGGMATVYLADDLKHERKVALKVLKPELAAVVGAERFLAEIKTTANLHHPHILPLHDSGEADGFLYYVMPQVEGESLRQRIDREKQLPVDEAVQITTAVAQALQHAHDRGVIHRDIKPANILMQDGQPVVSDFGIALAVGAAGGSRLTETGLSLGTPFYMSPEQATGDQQVGPPSDTYALAAVLYEMLTGDPPYVGSTAQAVLGKIIQGAPVPVTQIRKSVPTNVDSAIRRALEKLPADRFTGAQDFARALADRGFRHGEEALAGAAGGVRPWTRMTVILAAVAGLFVLSTVALGWSLLSPEPRPLARFEVTFGEDQSLAVGGAVKLALSPDGSRIVYVGVARDGGRQLWQRSLTDLEPIPIPGTEGAYNPVLSPDGLSVVFWAEGDVKTVSLGGGPTFTVASGAPGLAWGSDGMIYFYRPDGIYRVPETGGEPKAVTSSTGNHDWQSALPDGRGLLLTVVGASLDQNRIAVVGPEGGEVREILTGTMARYAASGHVVYATADGTLMAAPFDLKRLEVTGPSVPLLTGVQGDLGSQSQFALSETGSLVYLTGDITGDDVEFVWVTRSGEMSPVSTGETFRLRAGGNSSLRLSPDGTRIAFARWADDNFDIWTKELPDGPMSRLTFTDDASEYWPTWTPDGRSITFPSHPLPTGTGPDHLFTQRADGTGAAELVYDGHSVAAAAWSPNGEWLVPRLARYSSQGPASIRSLLLPRPGVDSMATPLIATEQFEEAGQAISRDGRWLAFSSNEAGRHEIFVRPFPNVDDGKWQISTDGGVQPIWAHNGRELFFVNSTGDVEVAEFTATDDTFQRRRTTTLFRLPRDAWVRQRAGAGDYDVAPDDERFLMARGAGSEDSPTKLVWVQNFFEELKARVPN